MAINCSQIQQTINYLSSIFEECRVLKAEDMQLLIDLIEAINICGNGGSNSDTKLISIEETIIDTSISGEDFYLILNNIEWLVNGNYNQIDNYTFIEPYATEGFYRTDILVGFDNNNILYIKGEENEDNTIIPILPNNAALLLTVNVFGDDIVVQQPPVSELFKIKAEDEIVNIIEGGDNKVFNHSTVNLRWIRRSTGFLKHLSISGLKSLQNDDRYARYRGQELIITNDSLPDHTLTINHLGTIDKPSINDVKFFLPNEQNLIIPYRGSATFRYIPSSAYVPFPRYELISINNNFTSEDSYVPYIGATDNVDLGNNQLLAESLHAESSYLPPPGVEYPIFSANYLGEGLRFCVVESAVDGKIHTWISNNGGGNILGNEAFGYFALSSNITGERNTAFGTQALYANTTGRSNTAFGITALNNNTTGLSNTAFGDGAMFYNVSGWNNVAFGHSALEKNISTDYNVAIGARSLQNNIGAGNTAVGSQAGNLVTTGNNNIHIGRGSTIAGSSITSGNDNTLIGGNMSLTTLERTANNQVILTDGQGNRVIESLGIGTTGVKLKGKYAITSINEELPDITGNINIPQVAMPISLSEVIIGTGTTSEIRKILPKDFVLTNENNNRILTFNGSNQSWQSYILNNQPTNSSIALRTNNGILKGNPAVESNDLVNKSQAIIIDPESPVKYNEVWVGTEAQFDALPAIKEGTNYMVETLPITPSVINYGLGEPQVINLEIDSKLMYITISTVNIVSNSILIPDAEDYKGVSLSFSNIYKSDSGYTNLEVILKTSTPQFVSNSGGTNIEDEYSLAVGYGANFFSNGEFWIIY